MHASSRSSRGHIAYEALDRKPNELNLATLVASELDPSWRMTSLWGDGTSDLDLEDFVMAEVQVGRSGDYRRQPTMLFGLSDMERPELIDSKEFKKKWPGVGFVGLEVHQMGNVIGFENGDPMDGSLIDHTYASPGRFTQGQVPGDVFQVAYIGGEVLLLCNGSLLVKRAVTFGRKAWFHLYVQDGQKEEKAVVKVKKLSRLSFCGVCHSCFYTLKLRLKALWHRPPAAKPAPSVFRKALTWLMPDVNDAMTQGHDSYIFGICWLPGNAYFVTSSKDGTAKVWESESGHCVHTFNVPPIAEGCLEPADQPFYMPLQTWDACKMELGVQAVLSAGRSDGYIDFWDVSTLKIKHTSNKSKCFRLVRRALHGMKRPGHNQELGVQTLVMDAVHHRAFGGGNGKVSAWSLVETDSEKKLIANRLSMGPISEESPPSNPKVRRFTSVVGSGGPALMKLKDAAWHRDLEVQQLAVSNEGEWLVACMLDIKGAKILDAATGEEKYSLSTSVLVTAAAFTPRGLALGFMDGDLHVYHQRSELFLNLDAKADLVCKGHVGRIWRLLPLQLHDRGLYLVAGAADGHANIFNVTCAEDSEPGTLAPLFASFRGHRSAVTSAVFHGERRKYDLEDEVELENVEEHSLFTASFDGRVNRWTIHPFSAGQGSADPGDLLARQSFGSATAAEAFIAPASWLFNLLLLGQIMATSGERGAGVLQKGFIKVMMNGFWPAYGVATVLAWSIVILLGSDAHSRFSEYAEKEERECDPGLSRWKPRAEIVGKMLLFVSQVLWVPLFGMLISVHDCYHPGSDTDVKVLEADPDIECYKGFHLVAVCQSYVMVVLFTFLSAPLLINLGDANYLSPLRGNVLSRLFQRMSPWNWWGGGVRWRRPMFSGDLTRRKGYYAFETALVFTKIFVPAIKQFTTYSSQLQHIFHYLIGILLFYAAVKYPPQEGVIPTAILELVCFLITMVPFFMLIHVGEAQLQAQHELADMVSIMQTLPQELRKER